MANICTSTYRITGKSSELQALYTLMCRLSREKKENGNWVGHIVEALNGEIPPHLYVRGWWSDLERDCNSLMFNQESAWEPIYEAWDFICSQFKTLSAYFISEESAMEIYLKRNHDKYDWFPEKYCIEGCTPKGEYFQEDFINIEAAFEYLRKWCDATIVTESDIEKLNLKWQEVSEDAFVYFYEYTEV